MAYNFYYNSFFYVEIVLCYVEIIIKIYQRLVDYQIGMVHLWITTYRLL